MVLECLKVALAHSHVWLSSMARESASLAVATLPPIEKEILLGQGNKAQVDALGLCGAFRGEKKHRL